MAEQGRRRKRRRRAVIVTVEEEEEDEQPQQQSQPLQLQQAAPQPHPAASASAARAGSFEAYYREQRVVPPDEWVDFAAALGRELPCSFRLSPGPGAAALRRAVEAGDGAPGGDETPPTVEPVGWLPPGYAYVVRTATGGGRQGLKRSAPRFHGWLTAQHDAGLLTRQELVSMVPPLLLAPQRGDRVLDMCAAPGSKTAQLLHTLTAGSEDYDAGAGAVLANDAEAKRCSILTHHLRRYGPAASTALLVSHHDAAHDPPPAPPEGFDRVLCDVPCSGDGTIRKTGSIAAEWSPKNGLGRHALQLAILCNGLRRLRLGGRLVYSTCSLNPHENEAVVAAALSGAAGAGVQIEDCAEELPDLRRKPGLHSWRVYLPQQAGAGEQGDGQWYTRCGPSPPAAAYRPQPYLRLQVR